MVIRSDKRENRVYLSLGTNVGDRLKYLKQAIEKLQVLATEEIEVSYIYESEPWGNDVLNAFLNCVIQMNTDLQPLALLYRTQEIEKEIGRLKKSIDSEYQNRIIDIDILTYNKTTIDSDILTIPHPLLRKRRFVLLPFSNIAPRFQLPYSLYSIEKHLALCKDFLECKRFEAQ